jgi:hypothetical protein
MNAYTKTELQKRAWIAESAQVDAMIEAIAALYDGNQNLFNCRLGKVVKLHWLTSALYRSCPDPLTDESQDCACSCLDAEGIAEVVLKTESLAGDPCVPDPQVFLDDSIPDSIRFADV